MTNCENCGTGITAYAFGKSVFCDYCRCKKLEAENQELKEKNRFLERCVTDKGKVIDELRDYLRWCYPALSWLSAQPGYREKVKRIEDLLSD